MSFFGNSSPLESLSEIDSAAGGGNAPTASAKGNDAVDFQEEDPDESVPHPLFTRLPKAEFSMPERPNYYKNLSKTVDVRHLMRKFGMQAGFHLPFANAENKASLEKLEALQVNILKLKADVEESRTAIRELKGHTVQSAIDIRFTQGLVDEKSIQCNRETDNDVIIVRVQEKRIRQLARVKADLAEYNERNRIRLLDLERRRDKMSALQQKVMTDKRKLEIWKEVSGKTESFLQLITGHKEHDDRHAWELENKQTDLGALNKELRMELDAAAMNTTKLSEQYARLSIEYRKEHKQRKEMVAMWAATLEAMKRKDMDVKDISKEYCDIRGKIRRATTSIKEQEKVVFEQEWNVRQTEFDQTILDRSVGELREKIMHEQEILISLKNEAIMNKVVIQQTTIAAQGAEAAYKRADERVKHFKRKAKDVRETIEFLKKKVSTVSQGKVVVEGYLGRMEDELRREEKQYHRNNREVEKMRKFTWERNNDKTGIEAEISRAETRQTRLKSSITVLMLKEYDSMEALAKKQSVIYRLDLDISTIETRMMRIVDDSVNPEYFKLQAKLVALREIELEVVNEKEFITKEVHIVKDFAYRYTKDIEIYSKKHDALRFMVDNINLEGTRMEGLLDRYKNEKKKLTVKMSLVKLDLKRLEDAYKINRGQVLSIAQRRATMQWAVLERKSEIKFAMQMLLKQRKELRGHTTRRKLAISNINTYCVKLKGRFELTTRLMSNDDGVTGEDAMTFQIHKIARERETLTAEQKKWESRLTEANREAEGLTNVYLVLKSANDAFKSNLAIASKTSVEARDVDRAIKNQKKSIVIRNRCNKSVDNLKMTLDSVQKQIDVTTQEAEDLIQIVDQKDREASSKSIEHTRLRDKILRWSNLLYKKTTSLRGKVSDEFLREAQNDLKQQIIMAKFQKAVEQVDITISDYPHMKEVVMQFLEQHNMMREFETAHNNRVATQSNRLHSSNSNHLHRSFVRPRLETSASGNKRSFLQSQISNRSPSTMSTSRISTAAFDVPVPKKMVPKTEHATHGHVLPQIHISHH